MIPELVIFDCDGVLVDSEKIAEKVSLAAIRELGVAVTVTKFREMFLGRTDAESMAEFERYIGAALPPGWDENRRKIERECFAAELEAVPGVIEAIFEIEAAGIKTCVGSSGGHEKMRLTLGKVGLWDHFDGRIFSATQVARGKPAPDLFLYAARQMGASAQKCVVVEDSRAGVAAGKAAGMTVVGYTGSTTPAEWLTESDLLLADLGQLPKVLAEYQH